MKTINVWDTDFARELTEELERVNPTEHCEPNGDDSASHNKIETLRELTFRILREVQSMREVGAPMIDNGIDFYAEVTRFEIDLINRALTQTRGHQGRAARSAFSSALIRSHKPFTSPAARASSSPKTCG